MRANVNTASIASSQRNGSAAFVPFQKADIEHSIARRFERQVETYPELPAVQGIDRALTYEALNRAANRVAHAILAQRDRREEPIALFLEHGPAALVGILGVLKSGKFYLPLDPTYPRGWLARVLDEAQTPLIVTNNPNLQSALTFAKDGRQVINIDAFGSSVSEENPGLFVSHRLVAYIVTRAKPAPTSTALRFFLEARLPAYMVPQAFVELDALPLTKSGKVDRRSLPEPGGARPALAGEFREPRTPVEAKLAEMWRSVLGVSRVGIHDNFFDLGGQSLLATKILAAVIESFEVDLTLRDFFEAPTVARMAESIGRAGGTPAGKQELAGMLRQVESLSEEEARRLIENGAH